MTKSAYFIFASIYNIIKVYREKHLTLGFNNRYRRIIKDTMIKNNIYLTYDY